MGANVSASRDFPVRVPEAGATAVAEFECEWDEEEKEKWFKLLWAEDLH